MGGQGYRLMVDRGRLTQRLLSLKTHSLEQAYEAAQGMVNKTSAKTAEVIRRSDGEVVAKYVKVED